MRRIVACMIVLGLAAGPVSAQLAGMPVWNSPKGGSGIRIAADYGMPSDEAGGGNAYDLRANLGLGALGIGAGFSSWEPDGAPERTSSFAATATFRVIGGALSPLNVNLIGGASTTQDITSGNVTTLPKISTYLAGAGVSIMLPIPGFGIEPYLSVTNRWNAPEGESTRSDIGWTLGANVALGMLGVQVAYDAQDRNGATGSVLGIGAHIALGVPGL